MKNKIAEIINTVRPEIHFQPDKDEELFGVLDSLDVILIVEELEKKFDILIDAEKITPENFASLNALESFIKSLVR
jgi:D-alanine--poly(phosphoribitol) ligase subunit 2